jgi:hypothetical protein
MGALDDAIDALAAHGMLTTEVEQLFRFSSAVEAEFATVSDATFARVLQPMGELLVNFGGGGLAEGFAFQQPYNACQQALGMFLYELSAGLLTLQAASALVAARYVGGDADSADLLAAVDAAFADVTSEERSRAQELAALADQPTEAQQRIAELRAQQEAERRFNDEVAAAQAELQDDGLRQDILDGDSELALASSDYYAGTGRGFAGQGPGAIWVPYDNENVDQVPVPDIDQPEDTAIDQLSDEVLLNPYSGDRGREIEAERERWYAGDLPGTEDDDS